MSDLFSYLLQESTHNSLLFNTSNINDQLSKERSTSVYYARSYYYLIYIQFFQDPELEKFSVFELARDIMLDPTVYLTSPDYSTAQIFPITLKRFHADPLPVADYLLNLLIKNKRIFVPSLKIEIPKNFIAFCNFPALYGFFTDPELNDCAYEFLKNLISLSELGCEESSPRRKKRGSQNLKMPSLKMNSSLSTSELNRIANLPLYEDSPLIPKTNRYSQSMAQIIYNFVFSFLLSSFSFTDILWHKVNEKIGKMVFLEYSQALNAIKESIKESSSLLPEKVYLILKELKEIDPKLTIDIVYDFLMVTFQFWQKQDGEGLTFTCNSTVFRVLETQHPQFSKKIYNNEILNVIYGQNHERGNATRYRDIEVLNSFLYGKSHISLLPDYFNYCSFGNFFLVVSYIDLIIYSRCFCDSSDNSPKMAFQQKLQIILNDRYPKLDKKRFSPYSIIYYPTLKPQTKEIESPFFEKYFGILKKDDFDFSDKKSKLTCNLDLYENLIEKKRNLNLANDFNLTLDRLRKNAFSYVMSCFLKKRHYYKLNEIFRLSLKLSSYLYNPSSLFLQILQSFLNNFILDESFISKKLRSAFVYCQEKIIKEEWESINTYKGNTYLFNIAAMLTTPRIGRSFGDAFRLFNFLFSQCFIVSDYYSSENFTFSEMISFIVKVSRYDFFLDVFIIFSIFIFTNQEIVEKINLKIIHNWETFFDGIRSNEQLFQMIVKDDQVNKFINDQGLEEE